MGPPVAHFEVMGQDGSELQRLCSDLFGSRCQTSSELLPRRSASGPSSTGRSEESRSAKSTTTEVSMSPRAGRAFVSATRGQVLGGHPIEIPA